ncbi:hypothetical protein [Neobacillus massiliamazoniensis]|uniref:hypothetical protein n=1 Tax=Neobacillus massiliamazoniensis TaxID=1499688 RepID=UPI00159EC379|nr:hypothetical protein [Neobacillus massiliamazoniensis]
MQSLRKFINTRIAEKREWAVVERGGQRPFCGKKGGTVVERANQSPFCGKKR